jgi:hypothetical protein
MLVMPLFLALMIVAMSITRALTETLPWAKTLSVAETLAWAVLIRTWVLPSTVTVAVTAVLAAKLISPIAATVVASVMTMVTVSPTTPTVSVTTSGKALVMVVAMATAVYTVSTALAFLRKGVVVLPIFSVRSNMGLPSDLTFHLNIHIDLCQLLGEIVDFGLIRFFSTLGLDQIGQRTQAFHLQLSKSLGMGFFLGLSICLGVRFRSGGCRGNGFRLLGGRIGTHGNQHRAERNDCRTEQR